MIERIKQWFGLATTTTKSSGVGAVQFPHTVRSDDGSLAITVHAHDLIRAGKTILCWTYETKGLRAVGQRELVLILKRKPGESLVDFPHAALLFFPRFSNSRGRGV